MKQWKLAEGVGLHYRCWDDECVVFDAGSGDTFLVSRLVGEILEVLGREGWLSSTGICDLIVDDRASDSGSLQADAITAELTRLARVALVERAP